MLVSVLMPPSAVCTREIALFAFLDGLCNAAHLRLELCGIGKAGSVIGSAVDPQA
jgi:hypothetical protein